MVGDLVLPCLFFLRGKVVCYGDKFLNSKANRHESYKGQSEHTIVTVLVHMS